MVAWRSIVATVGNHKLDHCSSARSWNGSGSVPPAKRSHRPPQWHTKGGVSPSWSWAGHALIAEIGGLLRPVPVVTAPSVACADVLAGTYPADFPVMAAYEQVTREHRRLSGVLSVTAGVALIGMIVGQGEPVMGHRQRVARRGSRAGL